MGLGLLVKCFPLCPEPQGLGVAFQMLQGKHGGLCALHASALGQDQGGAHLILAAACGVTWSLSSPSWASLWLGGPQKMQAALTLPRPPCLPPQHTSSSTVCWIQLVTLLSLYPPPCPLSLSSLRKASVGVNPDHPEVMVPVAALSLRAGPLPPQNCIASCPCSLTSF